MAREEKEPDEETDTTIRETTQLAGGERIETAGRTFEDRASTGEGVATVPAESREYARR